jgi:hypothetical protein
MTSKIWTRVKNLFSCFLQYTQMAVSSSLHTPHLAHTHVSLLIQECLPPHREGLFIYVSPGLPSEKTLAGNAFKPRSHWSLGLGERWVTDWFYLKVYKSLQKFLTFLALCSKIFFLMSWAVTAFVCGLAASVISLCYSQSGLLQEWLSVLFLSK